MKDEKTNEEYEEYSAEYLSKFADKLKGIKSEKVLLAMENDHYKQYEIIKWVRKGIILFG